MVADGEAVLIGSVNPKSAPKPLDSLPGPTPTPLLSALAMLSLLMVGSRGGGWVLPVDEEMGAGGGPIGSEGCLEADGMVCIFEGCIVSRGEGGTVFRSGAI